VRFVEAGCDLNGADETGAQALCETGVGEQIDEIRR